MRTAISNIGKKVISFLYDFGNNGYECLRFGPRRVDIAGDIDYNGYKMHVSFTAGEYDHIEINIDKDCENVEVALNEWLDGNIVYDDVLCAAEENRDSY